VPVVATGAIASVTAAGDPPGETTWIGASLVRVNPPRSKVVAVALTSPGVINDGGVAARTSPAANEATSIAKTSAIPRGDWNRSERRPSAPATFTPVLALKSERAEADSGEHAVAVAIGCSGLSGHVKNRVLAGQL
jgi:hypothetical protein